MWVPGTLGCVERRAAEWEPPAGLGGVGGIGERLRQERQRRGVSQRELARRLGVSASLISQIETGRSKPSVGTLYAVVTELGMSLDEVFAGAAPRTGGARTGSPHVISGRGFGQTVQRADARKVIELESGARWERLNPTGDR